MVISLKIWSILTNLHLVVLHVQTLVLGAVKEPVPAIAKDTQGSIEPPNQLILIALPIFFNNMRNQVETIKKKSLAITITENCNLACVYCYESAKSKATMNFDLVKSILDKEFLSDDDFEEMEIDFHGGEPFLEFDLIRDTCEYIWSRDWPKKYICYATTNGTLIHGHIKEWLHKNKERFWCGLSLDGNKLMHDLNRSDSFDKIDLKFFIENWPEQPVKMTLSPATLPYLYDGVKFIEEFGFQLSNNLAYGIDWSTQDTIDALSCELFKLVNRYAENLELPACSIVNFPIERISFSHPLSKWCGTGVTMKAYSVEGNEYPCHFFDPVTIGKEKAMLANTLSFENPEDIIDPMCKDCILLNACPTCYGSNYSETGNIALRDKNICKLNKISAQATAYLWMKKIKQHGPKKLNMDRTQYTNIINAINKIRNSLNS